MMIGVGVLAGILAGMFGIGGGIVLVPLLVLLLGFEQHTASGTSLVALLLPVGLLGVMSYWRAGKIGAEHLRWGLIVSLGMFAGTFLGARLALGMPTDVLRKAFAVFLIFVSARMWLA